MARAIGSAAETALRRRICRSVSRAVVAAFLVGLGGSPSSDSLKAPPGCHRDSRGTPFDAARQVIDRSLSTLTRSRTSFFARNSMGNQARPSAA